MAADFNRFNRLAVIVPSDSANIPEGPPEALWVGKKGDVALVGQDGGVIVLSDVPNGTLLPVRPWRVNATGTTADRLVGLYQI